MRRILRDKKMSGLWSVKTTTGRGLDPRYTWKCWGANSKARVSWSTSPWREVPKQKPQGKTEERGRNTKGLGPQQMFELLIDDEIFCLNSRIPHCHSQHPFVRCVLEARLYNYCLLHGLYVCQFERIQTNLLKIWACKCETLEKFRLYLLPCPSVYSVSVCLPQVKCQVSCGLDILTSEYCLYSLLFAMFFRIYLH